MGDFDLDLRTAEEELDDAEGDVVLGVLDGETSPDEWVAAVEAGHALVLSIEGDLSDLAAGFAGDVTEMGGELTHFRGFLIVTPPDVSVDTSRL